MGSATYQTFKVQSSPRPVAQRKPGPVLADNRRAVQLRALPGGLPAQLKAGIESLSGMSMDHVRVHRNSSRPAQLQAHAYTQGSDIHLAPGQDKHLPHEAWHVVQQAQGRVAPTTQLAGANLNDNPTLESEATRMGERASSAGHRVGRASAPATQLCACQPKGRASFRSAPGAPVQLGKIVKNKKKAAKKKYVAKKGTLGHETFGSPGNVFGSKYRRAIKGSIAEHGWKKTARRNLLVARFMSSNGKKRLNIVLRSAGMGGKHPRGVGGRSASHTEAQLAALQKNKHFHARVQRTLGKSYSLVGLYSSNRPCTSSGGGTSEGCSGIHSKDIGGDTNTDYHTTAPGNYVGGQGPNQGQVIRLLNDEVGDSDEDDFSDGSEDSDLDEDRVRGEDLTSKNLWK